MYRGLQNNRQDTTLSCTKSFPRPQRKGATIIGDLSALTLTGDYWLDIRLKEMVEDYVLPQVVTQPTRENILLHLILVNDPDLIRDREVGENLNGCDHHLIRF